MKKTKKKGLGRGLSALFGDQKSQVQKKVKKVVIALRQTLVI